MTKRELAAKLKISPRTIERLNLPHLRVGGQNRYKLSEVEVELRKKQTHMGAWDPGTFAVAGFLGLEFTGDLPAGDLIVGVGTLFLAFFTWRLARQTQKDVEKTDQALTLTQQQISRQEEALELTREGIEAQDMPFVIASPNPKYEEIRLSPVDHGDWLMLVRLWNVGRGPAIVGDVRLQVGDQELLRPLGPQAPVAAGAVRDINLLLLDSVPDEASLGTLRVSYLASVVQ